MKYREAQELARGLRELADFVETEGVKIPGGISIVSGYNFVYDDYDGMRTARQKMRTIAKVLAKAGMVEKKYQGDYLELRRYFGPLQIVFNTNRENVCRKVVVGTKHVKEHVIEAHDVDEIEWICDDPLLKESA